MNILALDTSGPTAAAAVAKEGVIVGECSLRHEKTHSRRLVPMMEALLNLLDMKPADMHLMAVANGPGSFTGLRIGVVTAKAMAYTLNIPVVEISSLMALAYTVNGQDAFICPMMDARNRQVYAGIYRIHEERIETVKPDSGLPIEILAEELKNLGGKVQFVGDAVPLYQDYLKNQGVEAFFAPDELFTHRAAAVARLAWFKHQDGNTTDAFQASPNYLRKSQAERMREKQTGSRIHEQTE